MSRWRWAGYVLCLVLMFGYEAYALFIQEGGSTSHIPPAHDLHRSREVSEKGPLQQSFTMHADGLTAIDVFPRPAENPPVGPLEVTLFQNTQPPYAATAVWVPIVTVTIDVATIDLATFLRIPLPRIDHSAGGNYRLDLAMPKAPPGRGLRFEQGGPTYIQGAMDIGGQRQWGDLKFRTEAERTTIYRNIRFLRASLPPVLRSSLLWLTAFAVFNWALATMLYELAFRFPPAWSASGQRARG
jgi:hypothetical protein